MKVERSKTLDKLLLLLVVFIVGIITLVLLHNVFMSLEKKLDTKTDNLLAKISIGEFISEDLHIIRSDFYELSTATTNLKGRELISKKINKRIDNIEYMLDILQNGGSLARTIRLNIAGHTSDIKEITYTKQDKEVIPIEVIDLKPKLLQIRKMVQKVEQLLTSSDLLLKTNPSNYIKKIKEIRRYYKSTPAFFIRITENNKRLLYEGELELKKLQEDISDEKLYYLKLEIIMVVITIFLVCIIGYYISKQIKETNEELSNQKISIRSILDAQPNIVIVTDGYNMRDVNAALFEYITKYKNFEQFKKDHNCICDYFEEPDIEDASDYITQKEYDGTVWTEYAYIRPDKVFKVCMNLKGNEYSHFILNVKKRELSNDDVIMVISFNDITQEIKNQRKLKELNDNLEYMVEEKTKELKKLNDTLEERIKVELSKNRKKDQQMIQQARFAALGEMIGNIAHQWRQPLSAISSTASGMQLQLQLKLTNPKEINKAFSEIMGYVQFLTQTIEDFRSFFKKDKEKTKFDIYDVLNKTLKITSASYKDNNIAILKDETDKKYITEGFPSELIQVFLNILNNAKDAFIENHIEIRYVNIQIIEKEKTIEISFHDNAKGIPKRLINKVFDPYFTTKHQSQGTGIGLYMSKQIIEKHMHGTIKVENDTFTFEDQEYYGACFKIEFPKIM